MFWNDYVINNLIYICELSTELFCQMGIDGKFSFDRASNVMRCTYKNESIVFERPVIELTERIEYKVFKSGKGNVLRQRKFGQYDFKNNTITVFVKNVESLANEQDVIFEDLLIVVLGHELFHAVHAHLLEKPSRWHDQVKVFQTKAVIESLATCFEYLLCAILPGLDQSKIVMSKLMETVLEEYPYRYAKNIILGNALHECGSILELSRKNFLNAYEKMILIEKLLK